MNAKTEPRMKWCGDGETEPMENLHLGNGMMTLAIMKIMKNGCHFVYMCHTEKIQMTNPCPSPKSLGLWFSECQWKGNISISHYEKLTNDYHFVNMHHIKKIQVTDPAKVWVSGILTVNRNGISASAIKKTSINDYRFVNMHHVETF